MREERHTRDEWKKTEGNRQRGTDREEETERRGGGEQAKGK